VTRVSTLADVRAATPDDIPELIRLRGLLFEALSDDFGPPPTPSAEHDWQDALAAELARQLGGNSMRIVVADVETGLASCGIGVIDQRLPSPYTRNNRCGYIFGVVTEQAHRGRGYAHAILEDLLRWFTVRDVSRVDLHASAEGAPLYRKLGFADHPEPTLRWTPSPL
jgi:ribosomal protein S18 acetylase RimI-like enzyme